MRVPLPALNQSLVALAGGAYGAPLVGLLFGLLFGSWFASLLGRANDISGAASDIVAVTAGLGGLWCGAMGYRWFARRKLNQRGHCPL